jgi:hypothetical protein
MVVLVVAALLVFGIGKLLGGLGSGGDPAQASTVSGSTSASPQVDTSSAPTGPVSAGTVTPGAATTSLAAPTGECDADSVSVQPSVPTAQAGRPISILLKLVGTQPACTFAVSSDSVAVKITSGSDRIWSSQDCPRAIPRRTVVVRSGLPAEVPLVWSGRRSDSVCSNAATWAMPGPYHVYAAAFGSAPSDAQFEIIYPSRGVVTKTAKPKVKGKAGASAGAAASTSPTPTTSPKPTPKATIKGTQSKCGGDNAAGGC